MPAVPLAVAPDRLRYRALLGVGGIGYGTFFALNGDHTLGREESRGGHFLDRRDYCKLHIIAHYVQTLLGPACEVLPIGKVGDDEGGRRLLAEMRAAGLDTRYVSVEPGKPTLFSFCFVYPDGSGGNLTTDTSACGAVGPDDVARATAEWPRFAGGAIALAAPEVPLAARRALLEAGRSQRAFGVASFTSAEMPEALTSGLLSFIDLLALNADEAATAARVDSTRGPEEIAQAAVAVLTGLQPRLWLSITAGRRGSWSWDGRALRHVPACEVPVVSTAGAGDAHLAGILVGLAAGLPLAQAQHLGTLVAAVSVASPHTIHPDLDRARVRALARQQSAPFDAALAALWEEPT